MRMKWLPAGIGLFLVGMSVVSFADERVYEQAEFPHEICGTWTDIHGGRTLEITPRAVDGDLLDGMYDVAGGGVQGAVKAVLLHEGQAGHGENRLECDESELSNTGIWKSAVLPSYRQAF